MSRIRAKNSRLELTVRSALHQAGLRYRIHVSQLPGKPDIVFPRHRTVVFVHSCFWHFHQGCARASVPETNQAYWLPKLQGNAQRDSRNRRLLNALGWRVFVVWECRATEARLQALARRIAN